MSEKANVTFILGCQKPGGHLEINKTAVFDLINRKKPLPGYNLCVELKRIVTDGNNQPILINKNGELEEETIDRYVTGFRIGYTEGPGEGCNWTQDSSETNHEKEEG